MAGNNFYQLNSQLNLNIRDSNDCMNVTNTDEPFKSGFSQGDNNLNQNYSTDSFSRDNININSATLEHYPQISHTFADNQDINFQQNRFTNFCSFPNNLSTNVMQSSSIEKYPPSSVSMSPFNPPTSLMNPPPGIPPFPPPPISCIGPPPIPIIGPPPIPGSGHPIPSIGPPPIPIIGPPPIPGNGLPSTPSIVPPPFWTGSGGIPIPLPVICKGKNESIKDWIKTWESSRNFLPKTTAAKTNISISKYKTKLMNLATEIKTLEKLSTHLQIMSKSLDEGEWSARKAQVIVQKKAVVDAMNDVKSIPQEHILFLLKKRKSKRLRLKKKGEECKLIKKNNKALCQLENSRIDMWLEKMKEQVERARREEDIKKQADCVLSEVFHKKAEAKRMLSLLTSLGKLRNARIHDRECKGEFVSKEAAEAFNSIIETLKKRWLKQINGYNLEEQGLRVMLSDAEVKRSNFEKLMYKQIHQQWLNLLFGHNGVNPFQAPSGEDLISVRQKWDKFVVEENSSTSGSLIPSGWVLPSTPSNNSWAKCLEN